MERLKGDVAKIELNERISLKVSIECTDAFSLWCIGIPIDKSCFLDLEFNRLPSDPLYPVDSGFIKKRSTRAIIQFIGPIYWTWLPLVSVGYFLKDTLFFFKQYIEFQLLWTKPYDLLLIDSQILIRVDIYKYSKHH